MMKRILLIPLLFTLCHCSQNERRQEVIIDDVGITESVFPKLKVFENALINVSANHKKGNEVVKELRRRVDELLIISEAEKIKDPSVENIELNEKVFQISQYVEGLEGINTIQSEQIQIAVDNLNEVEESLFKKENEVKELRSQNELLRKKISIALESEHLAKEDALKARKQVESLKKYRTIFFSVAAAFGLFLLFKFSAAGRLL